MAISENAKNARAACRGAPRSLPFLGPAQPNAKRLERVGAIRSRCHAGELGRLAGIGEKHGIWVKLSAQGRYARRSRQTGGSA